MDTKERDERGPQDVEALLDEIGDSKFAEYIRSLSDEEAEELNRLLNMGLGTGAKHTVERWKAEAATRAKRGRKP